MPTMVRRNAPAMALNGICPYFTMFPLDFPLTILREHANAGDWVLDPFCGRGTTNYASRLLGLPSSGIDSSPVAAALSQAKLANATPGAIVRAARRILDEIPEPSELPASDFWEWAYHPETLAVLCRLREGLVRDCRSDARKALRAVILGGLHGPRPKTRQAYFSNQSPRTYAPKPRYAVNYWRSRELRPELVDVPALIAQRATWYYGGEATKACGRVVRGDSRDDRTMRRAAAGAVRWVITSPPYYGLRTYLPDQWLRLWFLGGPSVVDYSARGQLGHASPESFAAQLGQVWRNAGEVCDHGARLVIRFGAINDRKVEPLGLLRQSLEDSGWREDHVACAGSAAHGRRQALHFARTNASPLQEYDLWATWRG